MNIVKRKQINAADLKDYMLLDFEDGEPSMIRDVVVGVNKVNFLARGTEFCLDKDEELFVVTRMTLVNT